MKLYATVTSEKGKPATKGGQDFLMIRIERNGLPCIDLDIKALTGNKTRLQLFTEAGGTLIDEILTENENEG